MAEGFVDIHCHLIPGIDDGASSVPDALAMARLAVDEGIDTVVATPHQLGNHRQNSGAEIRGRTAELQELLDANGVPLKVLAGGDVRIDDGLVEGVAAGEVLSLGDHRRHVLLELPHELYMPLEPLIERLRAAGLVGVLSHPERNQGLLKRPSLLPPLVEAGCLMQVTAGSLLGGFGHASQELSEQMCRRGLVHFLASDAHGPRRRRPRMRAAYDRAAELAGEAAASLWCRDFPRRVAHGLSVPAGPVTVRPRGARPRRWSIWGQAA